MVEMVAADDGSLIYRTPPVVRALVVALLVGDLVVVEVILQTSMVIRRYLRAPSSSVSSGSPSGSC